MPIIVIYIVKFYIIPLRGAGLWNAIWGYIALEEDKNTIKGAVFDHKGETAGLGAEITQKWFQEQSDELKKQFNIKTVDELRDTPLRQFTGFLMKSVGNRDDFWKIHGQAYISKVQFLFDTTEDNAQRYNYKRRLETKMAESRDLAVFNNLLLKRGGFT